MKATASAVGSIPWLAIDIVQGIKLSGIHTSSRTALGRDRNANIADKKQIPVREVYSHPDISFVCRSMKLSFKIAVT